MRAAVDATAAHRGVELQPLSEVLLDLVRLRAVAFGAYRRSSASDGEHLPAALAEVVADVITFADPLVTDGPAATWESSSRRWR